MGALRSIITRLFDLDPELDTKNWFISWLSVYYTWIALDAAITYLVG